MLAFELIGVIAVVISLLFVAYQIQQSNKIARVTTEYEIRNNHSSSNEIAMSDPAFASLLSKMTDSSFEPTGGENIQTAAFILRAVNFWTAAGTAHQNGMLSDETYQFVLEDIRQVVNLMPGLHPQLENILVQFPSLKNTNVVGIAVNLLEEYKREH